MIKSGEDDGATEGDWGKTMFGLGPMELLIVGVIAVLLFGNRLPEVGRSLGKGLVEFKKGVQGNEDRPDGDQPAK